MRIVPVVLLTALLLGCASQPSARNTDLEQLAQLLAGDYLSSADGGARAERPIYMRIRRIESPTPGTLALYSEMRHDKADGELYRQRLYLFDSRADAPLLMQSLGFADPVAATGLVEDPSLWVRKGLAIQPAIAAGCDTLWTRSGAGFMGVVDPATCVITGKRGDRRRIEGRTLITAESIGQLERGYDLDGKLLFGNPTGELYVWPRVWPVGARRSGEATSPK